jgi:putative ABC transport system permease protein
MLGKEPETMVGESVVMFQEPLEVIGVVEDFHFESAAKVIEPIVFNAYSDRIQNIPVRLTSNADVPGTLDLIEKTFQSFDPDYIMMHLYAAEMYRNYYTAEERLRSIVGSGTLLSVIIVLLGIYALVSHNIVSRTKEIAIRKVLGGSIQRMMGMIYASTLQWTLLASLLAVPLSWLYLRNWLNDYAVRINLSWWIFAAGIILVTLFQSLVTLGQTWKAARRNPVEGLRYE